MRRILCVGNRLISRDSAGPLVYDRLAGLQLPRSVHVVDAGLAGLNILHWFEGVDKVILVDAVEGFAEPGGVVVLDSHSFLKNSPPVSGHSTGLGYALACMPHVLESDLPEVVLIGVEGQPTENSLSRAVEICLEHAGENHEPPAGSESIR